MYNNQNNNSNSNIGCHIRNSSERNVKMLIAEGRENNNSNSNSDLLDTKKKSTTRRRTEKLKLVLAFRRTVSRFKLLIYSATFSMPPIKTRRMRGKERLSKFYIDFFFLCIGNVKGKAGKKRISVDQTVHIPNEMQKLFKMSKR